MGEFKLFNNFKNKTPEEVISSIKELLKLAEEGKVKSLAYVGVDFFGNLICDYIASDSREILPLIGAVRFLESDIINGSFEKD